MSSPWFLQRRSIKAALRTIRQYLFGKRGQRLVHGNRLFYRLRALALLHAEKPLGQIARRTEVRVWVDGAEAFKRTARLIRRARVSVVVQMFIWKDDETGRSMAQLLVDAADRGVHVDITKESLGDMFEFHQDFLGSKQSKNPLWKRFWSHPNIHVTAMKKKDHAKVFVIDEQVLLLTGMNIGNEYRYDWHDYMVEVRGTHFVEQYLTHKDASRPTDTIRLVTNTEVRKDIRKVMMEFLASAKHSLVLEHCYLSDPEALDAIIALSRRKVRVTVLLPEAPDVNSAANTQSIGRLLQEGDPLYLRVLMYPGMFHAKIALADRKRAFVGSANLLTNSLDDMGEVNVLLEERGCRMALQKLRATLRKDILKSKPISTPPGFQWFWKAIAWIGL